MSAATLSTSFDILGHIFSHYAKTETLEAPLETLLLVCRSWSDAALGHRALWSNFRVYIDIEGPCSIPRIWKARIPLRLERCGDTTPLDVDLRHLPDSFAMTVGDDSYWEDVHRKGRKTYCIAREYIDAEAQCNCVRESLLCIDELLILLSGEQGRFSKRWCTLHIRLRSPRQYGTMYMQLAGVLSRRMPTLTSLSLRNFKKLHEQGLSLRMPSLQHLQVYDPSGAPLPSFQGIRCLTVVESTGFFQEEISPKQAMVGDAGDLEELVIEGNFSLPSFMPKLWRLAAAGDITWPIKPVAPLPKITHLVLKGHRFNRLQGLVKDKAMNLSHLTSLGVHLVLYSHDSDIREAILGIFKSAKGLLDVHGNLEGVALVLRLIWESEMLRSNLPAKFGGPEGNAGCLLSGRRISLSTEKGSAILRGDETCLQLCNAAKVLRVECPEDSYLADHLYD